MRKLKSVLTLIIALVTVISQASFACDLHGKTGILPENNLNIPVGLKFVGGGITEAQFNRVIDRISKLYTPVVSRLGGTLSIKRNWNDGTVNAYASRSGKTWNVAMFGGLARHETVTEDGFALVVCHELGHHIGGAPKKVSYYSNSWASNEGQADYFANLKCLRKTFFKDLGII